jgi:hypothetical protein
MQDADAPRFLPRDVLQQILAQLDSHSLAYVGMTCEWLREEVAAVRTSINSSNPCHSDTTMGSLLFYVSAHRQHLTSFRAMFWSSPVPLSAALAALPNLSCLKLQPANLPATFPHLNSMTALRDLELRFDPQQGAAFISDVALAAFGLLASRLTALELRTTRSFKSMYIQKGHPIDQLYCLRKLKLPRGAQTKTLCLRTCRLSVMLVDCARVALLLSALYCCPVTRPRTHAADVPAPHLGWLWRIAVQFCCPDCK